MKSKKIYSLAFRKALVDEALNRTPTGGFSELEKRHSLKPGTLFDWVTELGPTPPPEPFSALHFWIGNTPLVSTTFCSILNMQTATGISKSKTLKMQQKMSRAAASARTWAGNFYMTTTCCW